MSIIKTFWKLIKAFLYFILDTLIVLSCVRYSSTQGFWQGPFGVILILIILLIKAVIYFRSEESKIGMIGSGIIVLYGLFRFFKSNPDVLGTLIGVGIALLFLYALFFKSGSSHNRGSSSNGGSASPSGRHSQATTQKHSDYDNSYWSSNPVDPDPIPYECPCIHYRDSSDAHTPYYCTKYQRDITADEYYHTRKCRYRKTTC